MLVISARPSQAIVTYSTGTTLGNQSVYSKHIKQLTILDEDVASTTQIAISKLGQIASGTVPFMDESGLNAASTSIRWDKYFSTFGIGTTTPRSTLSVQGTALISGNLNTGTFTTKGITNLNNVSYTWPTVDGASGDKLTTNATGVLTWESAGVNTAAAYAWTNTHNFTATTTVKGFSASSTVANPIILNTVSYSMPTTQGASSTVPMNNGSGNLNWILPNPEILLQDGTAYSATNNTTVVTFSIPAEKIGPNDYIEIDMFASRSAAAVDDFASLEIGTGSASTTLATGTGNQSHYFFKSKIFAHNNTAIQNYSSDMIISSVESHTYGAMAINTANKIYISFTIRTTNATDTLVIRGRRVLLYRAQL